jgi:hypothetical protein
MRTYLAALGSAGRASTVPSGALDKFAPVQEAVNG